MKISTHNQRHQTDKFDKTSYKVAVAGHICLDIIPSFGSEKRNFENLLIPGKTFTEYDRRLALSGIQYLEKYLDNAISEEKKAFEDKLKKLDQKIKRKIKREGK